MGVLFTFPSRYWFAIGRIGVLRLREWSPYLQAKFHVFRPTQGPVHGFPVRDYHPLWCSFPAASSFHTQATGLVRVRSPLLTEYR